MTSSSALADLVIPHYGAGSLQSVLPGMAAALGVPVDMPAVPFPQAAAACVVLVDGLGDEQLTEALAADESEFPFLRRLVDVERPAGVPERMHVGAPTTTATSMGSFGTGLPPGQHGLLGYQVRDPERGVLLNQLRWDPYTDPLRWQPLPTIFGVCAAAGIAVTRIGEDAFAGSGLTVAAHRGGEFIGAKELGARVDAAVSALAAGPRSLVYLYWGAVDAAGHEFGWRSPQLRAALRLVDSELARLAAALPVDTLLVITADHGMVDVPHSTRFDIASQPALREGIAILGGEPRLTQLYCLPGFTDGVLARMREAVGDRADVVTRAEAIAAGWFGPVADRVRDRIGDVLVAARGDFGMVDSAVAHKKLLALVGHHGSLTSAEQIVPLLMLRG